MWRVGPSVIIRLFMTNRRNDSVALTAAKAGFSPATGYRILQDGRLPSQGQTRRGPRPPDPLACIFDEVVGLRLEAALGLRSIAIFEELRRRYPKTVFGSRRTLERRIRDWRAMNGQAREAFDRLCVFIGGTRLMTLTRGRGGMNEKHGRVVDYRHVVIYLRRKPMALPELLIRPKSWPNWCRSRFTTD